MRIKTIVNVDTTSPAGNGTTHRSHRTIERGEDESADAFIIRIDDAIDSTRHDVAVSAADMAPWQSTTVRKGGPVEVHVMPNDGCHDERGMCPCAPREIEPGLWLHNRTARA